MSFQNKLIKSLVDHAQRTAIEVNSKTISYSEIHRKADRITSFLLKQKLEKETIIGILLDNRVDIISTVIGVINARCVFVLVDSSLPDNRLYSIVSDMQLAYLISSDSLSETRSDKQWWPTNNFALKDIFDDDSLDNTGEIDYPEFDAEDSLYVYFTSGSTGTPKGIIGKNSSLLQFIQWEIKEFDIDENSKFSQFVSPYFDAFLRDIFVPLLAGGTICIPPQREDFYVSEKLTPWLDESEVSLIHCVPSLFRIINNDAITTDNYTKLKYVLMSGEKINPAELINWYTVFDGRIQLVNMYGTTEATMIQSFHRILPADARKSRIPIGQPIDGTELLITKNGVKPCNKLVPGELYIISNYLTKGYLNAPELSEQKFVQIESGNHAGKHAFRTGDQARLLTDNNIELIGRKDRQIKLRGIRIEVDEVENVLLSSNLLKNVVVRVHAEENGDESLIAFAIGKELWSGSGFKQKIQQYAQDHLPKYMIPSKILEVDKFPLLITGKIDYKALHNLLISDRTVIAPSNKIEIEVLGIWKEILGDKEISMEDIFHEIGGNSLTIMTLISKINNAYDVRISLGELFKNPTIKKQAAFIESANKNNKTTIPKAKEADYYPVTSVQKRLFFLHQFDKNSTAYNLQLIVKLHGAIERRKLNEAVNKLVERHESFRTYFEVLDGKPVQKIKDKIHFEVKYLKAVVNDLDKEVDKFVQPFDLSAAPLIRIGVIEFATQKHLLIVDAHHIIMDGVSQTVLIQEFMASYTDRQLPELKLNYKDFAEWRHLEEQQKTIAKQKDFWLRQYSELPETLELPVDFTRPSVKADKANKLHFEVGALETSKLKSIAEEEGATMFMVVFSIFNVLLSKLSAREDIVIGAPVAGRHQHIDLEDLIGMFVTTLPLRNYPKGNLSFREFLLSVKDNVLSCIENQDYPYEELIDDLKVERDAGRNPLFDITFAYQNYKKSELEIPEIEVESYKREHATAKFDINFLGSEVDDQIHLTFEYSTALFKQETIERFITYFEKIVSAVIIDTDTKIYDIDILRDSQEQDHLLQDLDFGEVNYPKDKTLIDLFSAQVKRTPHHIALKYEDRTMNYVQLDKESTQLAFLLRSKGVEANSVVGLMTDRSIEFIIGLLAILKSGGAYLPIDFDYPRERKKYLLENSGTKLLLTKKEFEEDLAYDLETIFIDEVQEDSDQVPEIDSINEPSDLCYVIYTSGTTGNPKGVMVEHRNIVRLFFNDEVPFTFQSDDVWTMFHSHSFDFSVWEIFGALLFGGKLIIIPKMVARDTQAYHHILKQEKVSILNQTPSAFYNLIQAELSGPETELSLRHVIFGGEALVPGRLKDWRLRYPDVKLVNMYGITEVAVHVTYKEITEKEIENNISDIGKPLPTLSAFVFDKHMNPVPYGVIGELYVGGAGVTRGYLGKEQLTKEKFIQSPHDSDRRLYRTGDLARVLSSGDLEYLGRADHQVQLRGFRIELGEIENQLNLYPTVKEAVVIMKENQDHTFLTAYYVSEKTTDIETIRGFLSGKLPDYMIPSYYVHLEEVPLTVNGKLDKAALPDPEIKIQDQYVAPQTKEEKLLAEVWASVLGIDHIGTTDNFFSVGGDSIKSIQICSRIRGEGYELSVHSIFVHQNIKQLATILKPLDVISDQSTIIGKAALTPIQSWFFEGPVKAKHHYNQAVMLSFEEEVSIENIREIFWKLQEHHDALRMVFRSEDEILIQENLSTDLPVSVEEYDLKDQGTQIEASLLEISNQIQSGINLEQGPLMKVGLFHLEKGSRLLIVIHHLVVDGISWRILFEDIELLYQQINRNESLNLPSKTDSFLSWSGHLREYIKGDQFKEAKTYWESFDAKNISRVPKDNQNGSNTGFDRRYASFTLNSEETTLLLKEVHPSFNTQINDILLTALLLSVSMRYGHCKVQVDLESHGREEINGTNVSRTVGWFTTIYPVILEKMDGDLAYQIKCIKEALANVPNSGLDYSLAKYYVSEDDDQTEWLTENSQIIFNYLGQFDADTRGRSYSIAKERGGDTVSSTETINYDWDISGIVHSDKLKMTIAYSQKQYSEETITTFMQQFKESLKEIIDYCCTYNKLELTPSDLTYKKLSIIQLDALQSKYDIQDIYPLSPMQEGMLYHSLLDSESENYFSQLTYRLKGTLDVSLVEKSMNVLIGRHDILRTIFINEGYDRPLQLVLKERSIDFNYQDLQKEVENRSVDTVISACQQEEKLRKFDLSKDLLMRLSVIKITEDEYFFIWSRHHILMDGWCLSILINEFKQIYASYVDKIEPTLPVIANPYSNYIKWLEARDKEESADYWRKYLSYYNKLVTLPQKEISLSDLLPYHLMSEEWFLDHQAMKSLHQLSSEYGVTLNTIFQAAWAILLAKYNNTDDVVFGSVVSGRPAALEHVETMIGLFINTVPVRMSIDKGCSIGELLNKVQAEAIESEKHHFSLLSETQSSSELDNGLFDHLMVFENYPVTESLDTSEDFKVADAEIFEQTNYDLTIEISPAKETRIKIDYNANKYDSVTIRNVLVHLNQIIEEIISDTATDISKIDVNTTKEHQKLLYEFNDTGTDYSSSETVLSLFKKQVAQNPDTLAITIGDNRMTYKELDQRSDKLASYLQKAKGTKKGDMVGLMLERELQLIPSILGILKSGGTYIPIDPSFPDDRKTILIEDSALQVIITRNSHIQSLISISPEIVDLDTDLDDIDTNYEKPSSVKITGEDLAYVIYTSGSTGKPKGVMIEHGSLLNYTNWASGYYLKGEPSTFGLYTSISFDLTVTSIFIPLITNNKIIIYPGKDDGTRIKELVSSGEVDVLKLTPSHLKIIRDGAIDIPILAKNTKLIVGGEELETSLARSIYDKFGGKVEIYNEYGPTEATVGCMIHRYSPEETLTSVPIGHPINNTQVYVLDKDLHPVPLGATGELYVSGAGLSRGYLANSSLTEERFISNPFVQGTVMYKTGDLARRHANDGMLYKGRTDDQVKVHGYRIELGEIAYQLSNHPQITDSVVVVRTESEEGPDYLVGYYLSESELDSTLLVDYLSEKLPKYMIPAFYVHMKSWPLTRNGKLDKEALPSPEKTGDLDYVPPSNKIETVLQGLWSDVLKIKPELISANGNFQKMGGNSLTTLYLIGRIRKTFNVEISLSGIFEYPTIKEQAEFIQDKTGESDASIIKTQEAEHYPLSSPQKRVFFLHKFDPEALAYNMPQIVRLEGKPDRKKITDAFKKLIDRHESLRTSFETKGSEPVQNVRKDVTFEVDYIKADEDKMPATIQAFIRPFDLAIAPLMRVGLIETSSEDSVLIMDTHHIISDGVSQTIFIEEFMAIYKGGHEELPKLRLSYKDFVQWQLEKTQQDKVAGQKDFWINQFSEMPEILNLPTDFSRPAVKDHSGEVVSFELAGEDLNRLKSIAESEGATMFMVMFSMFNVLLSKLTSQRDIVIGTPVAGRHQHPELENILGMFVNTLAVRTKFREDVSFLELLSLVKKNTLGCLDNQDYPYEELVDILNVKRDTSRNPLFDVMFMYQNYRKSELKIPGLTLKQFDSKRIRSSFDVTMVVLESSEKLVVNFEYATSLFRKETVEKFMGYFRTMMSEVMRNDQIKLADIQVISDAEKDDLIHVFNDTRLDFDTNSTIHQLFEEQVSRHPHQPAISFEGESLTYQELNDKSDQLFRKLLTHLNGKEEVLIGIIMDRSVELVASMLAVLKAGCAYVPIDPEYPEERINFIIQDSKMKIILTGNSSQLVSEWLPKDVVSIDVTSKELPEQSEEPVDVNTSPSNLAYLIYTSGSTGNPKGVMVEHKSIINFVHGIINRISIPEDFSMLSLTTASFDIFVLETLLPLLNGSKIVLASSTDQKNTRSLTTLIKDQKVDGIQITPSHLKLLLSNKEGDALKGIKLLMVGGEEFPVNLLNDIRNYYSGKIYNMYGPTETTVWSAIKDLTDATSINIGTPIANTIIRILDNKGKLQPIGIPGELCIGGRGVARGYWDRAKLTRERFIKDPVVNDDIIYRTGDLAKWLPNGDIQFLGRVDNQVKISGYRIELGEVESQLLHNRWIEEAAVVVKDKNDDKFLAAYYTSEKELETAELRAFLIDCLPAYMVPSHFVQLEELPLTPNGKLDRKALPDPEIKISDGFIAPSNITEKELVRIWSEVLTISQDAISTNSSFFELGGHSILAIKLLNEIQNSFGINLTLPAFFNDPSIKAISKLITQGSEEQEVLPQILTDEENRYESFPLTGVQQAYWIGRKDIFEYGNVGTHIYSESYVEELDVERFNKALQLLIDRHEMLRMVVTEQGEQKILKEVPRYEAKVLDLNKYSEEEGQKLFDLLRDELSHQVFSGEEWPLFDIRITIFRDGTYKVHSSLDALIMDAGSLIILFDDFKKFYVDTNVAFPAINISFRDYILTELKLRETNLFDKSKKYWLDRIEHFPLAPELPLNQNKDTNSDNSFERHGSYLPKQKWNNLQDKAKKLGITPTVLLIGCLSEVLKVWSKSAHFTLNLTLFNRIPFHQDVDKILGDFTSLTLLEVDYRGDNTFSNRLKGIQDRMWEDLEHKYYSGVEVLREMSRHHGNTVFVPIVLTSTLGIGDENKEVVEEDLSEKDEKKLNYAITQTPQVWLDVQLMENSKGLYFNWDSIKGLFPDGLIDAMFEAYETLLNELSESENLFDSKSLIPLPQQQAQQRTVINNTVGEIPEKLLHEIFREKAKEQKDAIAIETNNKRVSYGELHLLSNQIGHELRSAGARPNQLIAVVMDKCWEQVTAALGILYAGAAYLPIDADLPLERIQLLLEQGEVDILLTTPEIKNRIEFPDSKKVIELTEDSPGDSLNEEMPDIQSAEDLAYVIFTSGSTGTPKGVMIDHRGAVNTVLDINERFNVTEKDKAFGLSSLSFDLSVYDIFGLLAAGGTIFIPDKGDLKSPEKWLHYVETYHLTVWNSVPALMQMMIDYSQDWEVNLPLRLVMMSGDWIPVGLPERITHRCPESAIISLGGATEASIWSIYCPIDKVENHWKSIPYGKPLKNQQFYVLKPDLSDCPNHVAGDLYIGGIGLAKGYWKDKEKTDSSFIIHPDTNERLYKTGDLGRYLDDGNIEFLGREDSQVKIQGYRIELGEIEEALKNHEDIQDAVAIATSAGGQAKRLVAYVVGKESNVNPEDNIGVVETFRSKVIGDNVERKLFKMSKPGLRAFDPEAVSVFLPSIEKSKKLQLKARSPFNKSFIEEGLTLNDLGQMLEGLIQHTSPELILPKYYYPSAGSLYPVQTYLHVRENKVSGLKRGYYYYHPEHHCLYLVNPCHQEYLSDADHSSVSLFLVGDLKAIAPLYGDLAEGFCHQEAGHMANLLINFFNENLAWIPQNPTHDADLHAKFSLDPEHIIIQEFLGGRVSENSTDNQVYSSFGGTENGKMVHPSIQLPESELDETCSFSHLYRKSYRTYLNDALSLDDLSFLLKSALAGVDSPLFGAEGLALFLYAKPGKVQSLEGGYYQYQLATSSLKLLTPCKSALDVFSGNDMIYENGGFGIFITGKKSIHSELASGYLAQAMMNHSPSRKIGLCIAGTVNQSRLKEALTLSSDTSVVYSLLGGVISEDQIEAVEKYEQIDNGSLEQSIKEFLRSYLPEYMIPGQFIQLDKVPLSSNGKVNRKALPAPKNQKKNEYELPSTSIEKELAEIWAEVLEIEQQEISLESDFFQLGGHSILAIQMINKLNAAYGVQFGIEDIFVSSDLKTFSNIIENKLRDDDHKPEPNFKLLPAEKREYYPISFAQRRIIYSQLMFKTDTSYNSTSVFLIEGKLQLEQLEKAFQSLAERYEILRTSFHFINGSPVQKVNASVPIKILTKDLRNIKDGRSMESMMEDEIDRFIQPFELTVAPLFRIAVVAIEEAKWGLLFDIEHSIMDKASHDIINQEFIKIMAGEQLEPVKVHYKDFALWQNKNFSQINTQSKQRQHWLNEFKTDVEPLNLPTDYPRSEITGYDAEEYEFFMGKHRTSDLTKLSKDKDVTMYTLMLTVFKVMLHKLTKQNDICIGMPYLDRDHTLLEDMVGVLLNTLIIRSYPKGTTRFSEYLNDVKDTMIKAISNGGYPYEMLLDEIKYQRIKGRNPLFDILFNSRTLTSGQGQQNGKPEGASEQQFSPYKIPNKATAFDLSVLLQVVDGDIQFTIQFKTDLFERSTVKYFMDEYTSLLDQIIDSQELMLDEYLIFDHNMGTSNKIKIVNTH